MFGLSEAKQTVGPEGSLDAKLCLIGEAPGAHEVRQGRPFCGPAGSVLDQCLQNAGIVRSDCYITNVVKERPPGNNIAPWFNDRKGFTDRGFQCVADLQAELSQCKANVFVPLGKVATCALLNRRDITTIRGFVFASTLLPSRKVLPTLHPSFALRGNYEARYYIASDLQKALAESDYPDIKTPERTLVANPAITFAEACENLRFVAGHDLVAFDIEVVEYQVSCISFATGPEWSFSLPIHGRWSEEEEATLWTLIAEILENPAITKIGHNSLAFDCWFLATRCGIVVQGAHYDTMIAHSIMFPEMKKSLAFLASIYTHEAYWKELVSFKTNKAEG